MRLKPLYATDQSLVDAPLTDAPCPWAPQQGLHLYHFPLSLDSQKVRQGLDELGLQWRSHVILLSAQQQFSPSYVRLNSRCVVPTLVLNGKVTTDTNNILHTIADRFGADRNCFQVSEEERGSVAHWIERAAELFIEALTYGPIKGLNKPFPLGTGSEAGQYHQDKVDLLSKLVETHRDDPALRSAYEKKRAVIQATREAMVTPGQMPAIIDATREALESLRRQLESGPFRDGGWLASEAFSLADVQWGAVLYRLRWLGLQPQLWGASPSISAYAEKLFAKTSFQTGVVQWSRVGRTVVLPTIRYKLLQALGLTRDGRIL
jgi:glutathione S-transferase